MPDWTVADQRLKRDGGKVDYLESRFIGGAFPKPPTIAVIHFTYGGSGRSSAEWFRHPGNPGSSAHVVIDRDGTVIQCVPWDRVAWHAGKSRWKGLVGLNSHSYGIELANWGYLKRNGGNWHCYTGTRIGDPFVATHRNGNPDGGREPIGWEPYPEGQFDATVGVVRALVEALGVTEIVGHEDISPTRKWDPGPAFDMARFKARVFGERASDGDNLLRVTGSAGVNLRPEPSTAKPAVETLKQGTMLVPLATEGRWIEVSVLGQGGEPRATGWVHGAYVEEVD